MDYDGNDTSCHNLQLAGEGRTKSSSLLPPYDFPKFDFSENLQGPLRFDSLVESEVFLGIQSQQDSQWIEDFSQGTNGMEFNSAPTDSCPISGRNNVWSEATSSESVEMLLKSVGQEEMRPEKSIVLESNACADEGTLTEHVEPGSKKDEKSDLYTAISEVTVPEDEFLNDDRAPKVHLEVKLREPEVPSAAHVCKKGGTSNNEGINSHRDSNLRESKTSAKESLNSGAEEASFPVADYINYNAEALRTLKASENVNADFAHGGCNDESLEKHGLPTGQEDSKSSKVKIDEASKDTCSVSSSLCSATELGGLNNQCTVGARIGCVGETNERESEMKSPERDGRDASFSSSVETSQHEIEVSPASRSMTGPFDSILDGSSMVGVDRQSAVLAKLAAGHFPNAEQMVNPCLQLTSGPDGSKMEDLPKIIVKSHLSSGDDNNVAIESCNHINEIIASNSSDMPVLSGDKQPESVEGYHKESIVNRQEVGVLSPVTVKSDYEQGVEENLAHSLEDFSEMEGISKIKERDDEQLTGAGNLNLKSKDVGSLSAYNETHSPNLSEGVTVNDYVHELQHQTVDEVGLENDETPHATSSRTTHALDDDPKIGQGQRAVCRPSHPHPDNDCEEATTRTESDVNFSTEAQNVLKIKDNVTDESAGTPLSDIASKRLQSREISNDFYVGKSPSMEDTDSIYSNHLQADVRYDVSSSKEGLVSEINQDVTMMKPEGEKESYQAAEPDKSSCGSPTIISSTEPSEMDKYQEETRASVNESIFECAKPKDATGVDTSFTFKVNALPDRTEGEPGRSWLPFNAKKSKLSVVVDEASPSVKRKAARTPTTKTPRQSARGSDGTPKGTSERKGRRASAKGMAKENTKKGKKDTDVNQESPLVKGDNLPSTLLTISSSSPHVQFGMTPPYRLTEQSNSKLSSAVSAPHLKTNKSSPSASFKQPFADLQQVQLRAQIFVYGSLIQGTAPDEACMVSAFGPSDGGRSIWEPVWRGAVERARSNKPNHSTPDTPLHSQSGNRASDAADKQSSHSSKVPGSPTGRSNNKSAIPATVNPIRPLSSPCWSISTPSRDNFPSSVSHKGPTLDYSHTVMPLHPYQTPPIKSFAGQTSWPRACFPGPWLVSPQTSTFNSSICFQPITMAEHVKLTPAKDTSGPLTSDIIDVTSTPASPVNEGASSLPDSKPIPSVEKYSVDSKPKKRKKVSGSDPHPVSLISDFLSEPAMVPSPFTNLCSPVAISATDASMVCPIDVPEHDNMDTRRAITCFEETISKITEAKNQAEDAAALAASAVSHSEKFWSELAKQKQSGLISEGEVKLASSSIAISAAASVAKAAAAAAKVAYSVSLQAKQMADEAFLCCKNSSSGRSSLDVQDLGRATPVSILKDDNITNQSNSILVAAKQIAKLRVEAASTASRQAENLDAIVKAAELASAAVSQAGKIVAMGEPLPLSDLIKAGPEGYWKLPQHSPELDEKVIDKKEHDSSHNLAKDAVLPAKVSKEGSVERGRSESVDREKTCPIQIANDSLDGRVCLVDGNTGPMHTGDREFRRSGGSEAAKSNTVVSQPDTTLKSATTAQVEHGELTGPAPEDCINKASLVEVFKREGGLKAAWYTANVLRLEDGKAYVCYNDLLSDEDSGNICEWISLEGEGGNAPIIRAAHPLTTLPLQATRKRRRAALGDYAWSVGDRVDVWIDDCWWEGVVAEKNEKDETMLKVHFPAQGVTSTVRAWNLRTSRTWMDGKWVECSCSRGNNGSERSDTPHEKRQKLETSALPSNGKDILTSDLDSGSKKPDESNAIHVSTSDRTFNIGKMTWEDKRALQRPLRSGQQKEGSKVIFGVPKPTGKKRKFMEVSKHFPTNRSDKSNETSNSVKFAKYLMPQTTASRGLKVPFRDDAKKKQSVESRSRVPNSRIPSRSLPRRGNLNPTLAQDNDNSIDNRKDVEDSNVHDENEPEKVSPEAPLSSLLANTFSSSSKRLSSYTKSDVVNKGKTATSRGKLNTVVEEKILDANVGNSVTEGTQPRRSNRRFQPTHRLLEGLESSMIILKFPSFAHDKGPRSQSKNVLAKGR